MPLINLSLALMSPMLADTFSVMRRVQQMGTNGRATYTATITSDVGGVIYPSSKNDLERFPNLQVTAKTITVITRFALRSESETRPGYGETGDPVDYAPDIVMWNGDNFVVSETEDWSNFGPGYIFAICQSMDLKDVPAITE